MINTIVLIDPRIRLGCFGPILTMLDVEGNVLLGRSNGIRPALTVSGHSFTVFAARFDVVALALATGCRVLTARRSASSFTDATDASTAFSHLSATLSAHHAPSAQKSVPISPV